MKQMNNIIEKAGSDVALSEEVCEKIVSLEKQAKEIKKQQDSMKAEILDAMQKYGVLKLDNEFLKIALVPEHDAERFDIKTFKDENPDVYDMYVKISEVKPSIRITVK
jgi:regulator of replication initiation timing